MFLYLTKNSSKKTLVPLLQQKKKNLKGKVGTGQQDNNKRLNNWSKRKQNKSPNRSRRIAGYPFILFLAEVPVL